MAPRGLRQALALAFLCHLLVLVILAPPPLRVRSTGVATPGQPLRAELPVAPAPRGQTSAGGEPGQALARPSASARGVPEQPSARRLRVPTSPGGASGAVSSPVLGARVSDPAPATGVAAGLAVGGAERLPEGVAPGVIRAYRMAVALGLGQVWGELDMGRRQSLRGWVDVQLAHPAGQVGVLVTVVVRESPPDSPVPPGEIHKLAQIALARVPLPPSLQAGSWALVIPLELVAGE